MSDAKRCDECGTYFPLDRDWHWSVERVTAGFVIHGEPDGADICSDVCLLRWAYRRVNHRRKQRGLPEIPLPDLALLVTAGTAREAVGGLCSHGVVRRSRTTLAFTGPVLRCTCCENFFGELGGVRPGQRDGLCPSCRGAPT